ncbi:MAG: recombinase family protein [Solirubrobacteraceae bacterium]
MSSRLDSAEVPCVIYSAKSTDDARGSLKTQIADCAQAISREGGRVYGSPQSDERYSGYSRSRGPALLEAKRLAVEAAACYGRAELWVQHSDRLARGDGRSADHLIEVWLQMRKANVRLRSVQDDSNLENIVMAAVIGERNSEDSRRKAAAVTAGKVRQLERGERLGGPVPDGYRRVVEDEDGEVRVRYALDPERAPIVRRIFELAGEGMGDPSIARTMNVEGHRTRSGKSWQRRRIQDTVTNPYYAGRIVRYRGRPDQQVAPGNHPPLVDPATFDSLRSRRAKRDKALGSPRRIGRPPRRYVLHALATCMRCRQRMFGVTSTYKRTDGSHARRYVCPEVKGCTGLCAQPPVDAEAVDRAVLSHLDGFTLDFGELMTRILNTKAEELRTLDAQAEDHQRRLSSLHRREDRLHERLAEALEQEQKEHEGALLEGLSRARAETEAVESTIGRIERTRREVSQQPRVDALLDFVNDLKAAVRGTGSAGHVTEINASLRDLYSEILLNVLPDGQILLMPTVHDHVDAMFDFHPVEDVGRLIRPHEVPFPPSEWPRYGMIPMKVRV